MTSGRLVSLTKARPDPLYFTQKFMCTHPLRGWGLRWVVKGAVTRFPLHSPFLHPSFGVILRSPEDRVWESSIVPYITSPFHSVENISRVTFGEPVGDERLERDPKSFTNFFLPSHRVSHWEPRTRGTRFP